MIGVTMIGEVILGGMVTVGMILRTGILMIKIKAKVGEQTPVTTMVRGKDKWQRVLKRSRPISWPCFQNI